MPDAPVSPPELPAVGRPAPPAPAVCDICGAAALQEVRCKVICGNCRTILQSCADL